MYMASDSELYEKSGNIESECMDSILFILETYEVCIMEEWNIMTFTGIDLQSIGVYHHSIQLQLTWI